METTEVTCPAGTVLGTVNAGVRHFHSIPVVKIDGPFDDPRPQEHGLLIDATSPRPGHPHLSITTPAPAPSGGDLPVLVWVHGGGFETGDHTETFSNPDGFAREDVVHVRVGYRLKFSGFAQFSGDAPSHYRGVADVAEALAWVQRNIEAFGGDPTNVTLMGQSAGAAIVLWLCRRDHYKGEFRRALAMSPAFPRRGFEARKWAVRGALGTPVTRGELSKLSPEKLERGYTRFSRHFPTDIKLGPHPLDPAEMAEVPLVLTCTDEEFYSQGAALDRSRRVAGAFVRIAGRSMGLRKGAGGDYVASISNEAPVAGRFLTDALSRRFVDAVAEGAPGPVWVAEHPGYAHSGDLEPLFAPDAWLLEYVRTGEVGWPEYEQPDRLAARRRIGGEIEVVADPLGYVRGLFADPAK